MIYVALVLLSSLIYSAFQCKVIPQLTHQFCSWWTFKLNPNVSYSFKQCCKKYSWACLLVWEIYTHTHTHTHIYIYIYIYTYIYTYIYEMCVCVFIRYYQLALKVVLRIYTPICSVWTLPLLCNFFSTWYYRAFMFLQI